MQWGGGSIVVWDDEKDSKDGGKRKLTYRYIFTVSKIIFAYLIVFRCDYTVH